MASFSKGLVTINDDTGTSLANGTNVLASNNLTWSSGSNAIIGDTGYGGLTVADGSDFLMRQVFVGNTATGIGELTLTGAGTLARASLNSNTGVFTIGRFGGIGTAHVLAGAQMLTTSTGANDIWVGGHSDDNDEGDPVITSTGTLNVDGAGSFVETEDLNVGVFGGTGFLNITNAGNVTLTDGSSPDVSFGSNGVNGAVGQGFGVVDGDGSLLNARAILVGNSGVGTLAVSDGGEARTRIDSSTPSNITIGNSAGGFGKAAVYGFASDTVTPSLIDSEDSLIVGNAGLGILNVGLDLADNPVGSGALQVDLNLIIGEDAGNNTNNRVVVSGPDATVNTGGYIRAGVSGTGTFEARAGATVTVGGDFSAGTGPGGTGTILVDGPGTTVTSATSFVGNGNAGPLATGVMTISNQAVFTMTGSTNGVLTLGDEAFGDGTINVTGAGSLIQSTGGTAEWWIGGSSNDTGGVGTLNILDSGQAIMPGRAVLGWGSGSSGTMLVDGAGSVADVNGDFVLVGFNGTGNLDVTDGGVLNADNMFVADQAGAAGSQLDVDGAGSVVSLQGLLHVGDTGRGVANVTNGGVLNVALGGAGDRLIIGDEGGADGSTLTIDGAGSRVDYFGTDRVSVGLQGGATNNRAMLNVLSGGVLNAVQRDQAQVVISSGFLMIGDEAGSHGQVTVDGPGSRIDVRFVQVGDGTTNSSGILDLTNGGVLAALEHVEVGGNGAAVGTVNVDGAGSQLTIGDYLSLGSDLPNQGAATGTMNIADGGFVFNQGQAYIGHFTGSFGTATLGSTAATDSLWVVGGELTIAGTETSSQTSGAGTLNVNTGGVVNIASNLRVRNLGEVNLVGGEVIIGGDLILTDAGSDINFVFGKLRFANPAGRTFSPNDLERILEQGGANRPTLFTNMELAVDGTATIGGPLRILGGTLSVGSINPASAANIDFDTGTLNLTGESLAVGAGGLFGENLTITDRQTINMTQNAAIDSGSVLTIIGGFSSGGLTNNGDLVVIDTSASGKTLGGPVNSPVGSAITLIGDTTFAGDVSGGTHFFGPGTANFAADYAPGDSPAQINFAGGVGFESTATLEIEIGGFTPGTEHDQLVVAGDARLGGQIDFELIGGFIPTLGDSFVVLTSGGLNGTEFDSIGGRLIGSGLGFSLTYTPTDVIAVVVNAMPADFDMDGDVDDADFGLAFAAFTGPNSGPSSNPSADLDGDGDVDDADYGLMFAAFTGPGPGAPANVPEPASLAVLTALLALGIRRRR